MYSTCLFCHGPLGTNEIIEHFPVGRRLAFDAAKGRLWVVCPRCQRWNLTPLEERWEAIEDLERRVRKTHLRVSTDNIGLARLPGGLDAIRIGSPLRPELAGWRYGQVLVRRFHSSLRMYPVLAGGAAAYWMAIAGILNPWAVGAGYVGALGIAAALRPKSKGKTVDIPTSDHRVLHLDAQDIFKVRLMPTAAESRWMLSVPHRGGTEQLTGEAGMRAAAILMPILNALGARSSAITSALELLDHAGTPDDYFARLARVAPYDTFGMDRTVPNEVLLALEIAAHDAAERQALAGELAALEDAWRQADVIAGIADDLLAPQIVVDRFRRITRDHRG